MHDSLFPPSLTKFSLVYLLAWHPPLHTPYISSTNHCLLFAAHAHTIATRFAIVRNYVIGMIDDHDRCECVNVSSGTGSPGVVPDKIQRAVKWLFV